MKTANELRSLLRAIDHRGYPAYKETRGSWRFNGYTLVIEHVQGDPFAAPSALSVILDGARAGFPAEYLASEHRKRSLEDYLLRNFCREVRQNGTSHAGSGKSGLMEVSCPGQEALTRSALECQKDNGQVRVRFCLGFPANGRSIKSGELIRILFETLPGIVEKTLVYAAYPAALVREVIELADDRQYIREQLEARGLVAFVADGSILPRASGVSDRPMPGAVPFRSPDSLAVTMRLPHRGELRGMGIQKGITLIVGGGYHGKSTLLAALELGVYDHVKGDGREFVITDPTAMAIRAEDGRSVRNVDISAFISGLPNRQDTSHFSTEDASGSTSEAANVIEAISTGTRLLLVDEDTCATNFMVRDSLMQEVVARDQEPITPFIEKMRSIASDLSISIILVAGSQGAFFHVADRVIQMDSYVAKDITVLAKEAANASKVEIPRATRMLRPNEARIPLPNRRALGERVKIKALGRDAFLVNHEETDLRAVEQLVDREQTEAIANILVYLHRHLFDGKRTLWDCLSILGEKLGSEGFSFLDEGRGLPGTLAMPRLMEISAAINRSRWTSFR